MSCKLFKVQNLGGGKLKVINLCDASASPTYISSMSDFYNLNIPFDSISIPNFKEESDLEMWICDALTGIVEEDIIQKTYIGVIERKDPNDSKLLIPIAEYVDNTTGKPCYFLTSDVGLTKPIDINDYDMSNFAGLPPTAEDKTTGKVSFELCGELVGTFADVLAAALLNPEFVMPDGSAPDGLIGLQVVAEYKGQTCAGATTTGQGATIGAAPAIIASLDGGQVWCSKHVYTDADCDGKAANCLDLTTAMVIPAGHGVIIEAIGVVCDADDLDAVV